MREEGAVLLAQLVIDGQGLSHPRTAASPGIQVHQEGSCDLCRCAVAAEACQVRRVHLAARHRLVAALCRTAEAGCGSEGFQRAERGSLGRDHAGQVAVSWIAAEPLREHLEAAQITGDDLELLAREGPQRSGGQPPCLQLRQP